MPSRIDRRQFITISAASAGLALIPDCVLSKPVAPLVEWRGTSLGALATIRIHHEDRAAAEGLTRRVVAEAKRLEAVFSLYQQESSLCALNRAGLLVAPPSELADLLSQCDELWRLTDGKFDPTVQALWRCYADYFAAPQGVSAGPPDSTIKRALDIVGWDHLRFDRDRIVFARPGMGLTLNGVAQGYITDRVVDLLQDAGIENCLVDMGEIRGRGLDGQEPWRAAIEASGEIVSGSSIPLLNRAIATSGASGFRFDEQGRCNHLFDPVTGTCASPARTVTVVADTATTVDALSTAFTLMDEMHIEAVAARFPGAQVYVMTTDGTRMLGGKS